MIVPVGEAKTTLSKLLALVEDGEDVVISRSGAPVVRLVPVTASTPPPRRGGFLAGEIRIGDDFDDPLPPDLQRAFDGGAADEADSPR